MCNNPKKFGMLIDRLLLFYWVGLVILPVPAVAFVMLLELVIFPPSVALVIFDPAVKLVSGVLIFCAATEFTARKESTATIGRIRAICFLINESQRL